MRPPDQEFATDHNGRFRVEGLLPNRDHELILESGTNKNVAPSNVAPSTANPLMKELKTRTGEIKDLGDIRVRVVPTPKKNG